MVVGSSPPMLVSNPCKVRIEKARVESMAAIDLERQCRGFDKPRDRPKSSLADPRFAVAGAGVSTIAAALGALFSLLN